MRRSSEAIEAYFTSLHPERQSDARDLRSIIRSVLPDAEERLSSGAPFFWYRGRRAVGLGVARRHLSFFIMHGNVLKAHQNELVSYDFSATVVRFPPGRSLPADLIRTLVRARISEIDSQTDNRPA